MSSRRVPAAVPFKPSAAPVLVTSRAVSLKSSIKINGMGSSTAQSEQHSRLPTKPTTSAISSKDLVSNSKMGSKSSSSTTKPLWHSVRSLGSRVAPSNKQVKDKLNNSVEQQMVSSTGTESSGVFSDTENNDRLDVVPNNNNRFLRPPQTSTSRLSAAVAKTASFRLVKRPTPPNTAAADQAVIVELRNQIHLLKNQHQSQLDQQNREVGEKFRNEMAIALAEKESQAQQQLEAKEAAWRAEWSARLAEERAELERQLAEEKAAHEEAARAAAATLADERRMWQQQIDVLSEKARYLLSEKERLDRNIRQEVDTQVQATVLKYNQLQKETSSLQAVCELKTQELRNLRQELEKVSSAAEEVPHLKERLSTLGNMVEGLKAQLEQKTNEERRLQLEVTRLESANKEESMTVQRLSMQNEQLCYKIQSLQRRPSPTHTTPNDCDRTSPTKGHHHTSTPTETPKTHRRCLPPPNLSPVIAENGKDSETNNNNNNNNSYSNNNGNKSQSPPPHDVNQVKRRRDTSVSTISGNRTSAASDVVDDVFIADAAEASASQQEDDDTSPTVRDFTKKNDSVSYVLDLGGEHSPTGAPPIPYLPPGSPWLMRRNNLVRSASLRYPHRSYNH